MHTEMYADSRKADGGGLNKPGELKYSSLLKLMMIKLATVIAKSQECIKTSKYTQLEIIFSFATLETILLYLICKI